MIEVKVKKQYADCPQLIIHETEHPNFQAKLVVALLERWGMVAGEPDGEDSAGRVKLRLSTPQELARRACDVAAESTAEIRQRGWFTLVPTWDEMEAEVEKQKRKEK